MFERCLPHPQASTVSMDSFVAGACEDSTLLSSIGLGKSHRSKDIVQFIAVSKVVSFFRRVLQQQM